MKRIVYITICTLLALALAPACDREKPLYGDELPPVEAAEGHLSLAAMTVVRSAETETHDRVLRPESAATSPAAAAKRLRGAGAHATAAQTADAQPQPADSYRCLIADAQGGVVRRFAYGARPAALDLPAGAYTLTVESAEAQPAAWDAPRYAASQELLVSKNATVEVGEVRCTPAAVGVSLEFDPSFDAQATATVDCGGDPLVFTPAEGRTGWFAAGAGAALTVAVAGRFADGQAVSFSRSFAGVRPGQHYRFTVKGRNLAAPTIEWIDHDIRQRYRAVEGLDARIRVAAPAGIRSFVVEIVSEKVLTPEVLESVGLRSKFDLTQPAELQEMLEALGFPTGDKVTGRTEVSFDITQFMGLIPLLGNGDSDFRLTVTDAEGQTAAEAVMVYSSDEEPDKPDDPAGLGQDYPGGSAQPLEPPCAEQPYPDGEARPIA